MHVNGRLTAPPQLEAVLVTNSVDSNLHESSFQQLTASGTSLENFMYGSRLPLAQAVRHSLASPASRAPRQFPPVSATHISSTPWEAAAAS
jgi:hypothetical protein